MSGAFAGLGGVTAGSGFVEPYAAVIIGSMAATSAFYSVRFFKDYLLLDDVLDVTSLQGTAGVVGSLLVGVFATSEMQPDVVPMVYFMVEGSNFYPFNSWERLLF